MYAIGMLKDKPGIHRFEIPTPQIQGSKDVLVRIVQAGICGTDRSMVRHDRKDIAPGADRIVLGHEAVGVVEDTGSAVGKLKRGDVVVPTVRRGCGECASCAAGQSDMCETGLFTERGIHKLDGFFTEHIVDDEKNLVVLPRDIAGLGVLIEPLSICVKAFELVELVQSRYPWACTPRQGQAHAEGEWGYCKTALVFGAGPIGFLMTAMLRYGGVATFVLENRDEGHPRVELLKKTGAKYVDSRRVVPEEVNTLTGPLDMIVEATGVSGYALRLVSALGRNGIYIFTGIPSAEYSEVKLDGNLLLRQVVRMNQVIVGSVNANKSHFEKAAALLAKIYKKFPDVVDGIITRRVPFSDAEAVTKCFNEKDKMQIKEVIDFSPLA
ncbi:MAG TPA: glucose 1-dehydrogenase [bacterium]|nr:glucose 1-dehydrogenase [bacterium]